MAGPVAVAGGGGGGGARAVPDVGVAGSRGADLRDSLGDGEPAGLPRRRSCRVRRPVDVDRVGRVVREEVLDVHEQQLLVLLLVMATQLQQFEATLVDPARLEGADHGLVDAGAEVPDLRHRRAGDEPALRPRLPWADRLVVRVEQEAEHRLRRGVARQPTQHELLEEPRGVCPVPRRGAGRGHRLGDLVLGAEPGREQVGEPPDLLELLDHALGAGGGGDGSGCHGFPRGLWSTAGGPRRRTLRPRR